MNAKPIFALIVCGVLGGAHAGVNDGLVAFYPFWRNAIDRSGNYNNGAIYGATLTEDRFGVANNAYRFDGINDYIQIPDAEANELAREFTISFWMNPSAGYGTSLYGSCHIISKWGDAKSGAASYSLGVTGEGCLYFATCNDSVTTRVADTSVLSTNTWHFIALVREASGYKLCRDAILLLSTNSLVPPQHNSGVSLNLGRDASGDGGFYRGALDEVRIYNRALSDSEILELYTLESGTRVLMVKAVKPAFSNLRVGTSYQLQASTNLSTWTDAGAPFTATASYMAYPGYWDVEMWNSLHFRLQAVR